MSSIGLEIDISKVIDDLCSVYWNEISNDNPSYIKACNVIRDLCIKYGIKYNNDVDSIYNNILSNMNKQNDSENKQFQNEMDIILSIRDDLKNCTDIKMLFSIQSKYINILNQYGRVIAEYVKRHDELSILLSGGIESGIKQIDKQGTVVERKKPKNVGVYDETGWPVEDENGKEIIKLETEDEINQRVIYENEQYQKLLNNINIMKISLAKWMEYLLILPKLSIIYKTIINSVNSINELENEMVLNDYKSDKQFMSDLNNIMAHDTNKF